MSGEQIKIGDRVRVKESSNLTSKRGREFTVETIDCNTYGPYALADEVPGGVYLTDLELVGDAVNHPTHYTSDPSGVECIQITRHRNFNVGNAIKYLWRAGMKEDADRSVKDKEIEDLRKAIWYVEDEIRRIG